MVIAVGIVCLLLIYVGVGRALLYFCCKIFMFYRLTVLNYQQRQVPFVGGFFLCMLVWVHYLTWKLSTANRFIASSFWIEQIKVYPLQSLTMALTIVFAIGWVDDTLGDRATKGFRGHLRKLRHGKVTTGLMKVGGIGAVSLWVAAEQLSREGDGGNLAYGVFRVGVYFLVLCFMTNLFNLLDVRPGRALKGFWLIALPLLIGSFFANAGMLWPLLLGSLLLLPADLKSRLMLGDSGANMLGFALGFMLIGLLSLFVLIVLVLLLALLHWFAEKHSITQFVARVRWLAWLDEWGRMRT